MKKKIRETKLLKITKLRGPKVTKSFRVNQSTYNALLNYKKQIELEAGTNIPISDVICDALESYLGL